MEQIRLNCVHKHAYPDQSLSTESLLAGPIHMISNQSKHLVLHSLRAWGIASVPVSADPLTPVFFAELLQGLPTPPFINAIGVALICIFSLGIFLGKISRTFLFLALGRPADLDYRHLHDGNHSFPWPLSVGHVINSSRDQKAIT